MSETKLAATSFPKSEIKVLLLENIHASAARDVRGRGLPGRARSSARCRRTSCASALARRARARHPQQDPGHRPSVLDEARAPARASAASASAPTRSTSTRANTRGVPVFNAPFSNTRSVAELVIAEIVMLARQLGDRIARGARGQVAQGRRPAATRCAARRSASSATATSARRSACSPRRFGMRVVFYDIVTKLPMGNNRAVRHARRAARRGRLRHAARAGDAADARR